MKAQLQDLRFLYMAKSLEDMFEGLERAFERHIPDGAVRDALRPIFTDGPFHRRLKEAYERLNAEVAALEPKVQLADLLDAIADCERTAQKFYEDYAKRLSDPKLADIFLGMAREEAGHARAVAQARSLVV